MYYYCAVIISVFLLAQPSFAQLNEENDSLENKNPAFNISNDGNYPIRFDTINPYIFYNNESKIFTIYKPDFNLIRNKLTYSMLYQRSFFPPRNKSPGTIDRFNLFKESLRNTLALEYKKRLKYDLGEFGRYLGISKQIFAIILGIISLL
jgi:hypothetical protein